MKKSLYLQCIYIQVTLHVLHSPCCIFGLQSSEKKKYKKCRKELLQHDERSETLQTWTSPEGWCEIKVLIHFKPGSVWQWHVTDATCLTLKTWNSAFIIHIWDDMTLNRVSGPPLSWIWFDCKCSRSLVCGKFGLELRTVFKFQLTMTELFVCRCCKRNVVV